MMQNHFEKGLKAGLKSTDVCMTLEPGRFCNQYSQGYVLGYCYQIEKKTGDRRTAAREAGRLTRRYRLDREIMSEFYSEYKSDEAACCFDMGYREG